MPALRNLAVITAALVAGCGGDDQGKAPSISNLAYSPNTVTAGGTPTISGTFDFSDADGDADLLGVAVTTPGGQTGEAPPAPAQGVSGRESGTVFFAFMLNAGAAGTYNFELWLIDEQENESNRLGGSVIAQ